MTTEEKALLLDRMAIIQVVSALRHYRAAAEDLLSKRYRDGECDAFALSEFAGNCAEIEEGLKSWATWRPTHETHEA